MQSLLTARHTPGVHKIVHEATVGIMGLGGLGTLVTGALRSVLTFMPGTGYVGASGLAGYGDNNSIQTRKIHANVYIIGDGTSAAGPGQGLMAPRVRIAAHHQANQILRILLGKD